MSAINKGYRPWAEVAKDFEVVEFIHNGERKRVLARSPVGKSIIRHGAFVQVGHHAEIYSTIMKTHDHITDCKKIMVSVSGGSDSDILVDLFERIGYEPGQVVYVWFDTGLEYEATKRHLVFLEEKYGVQIQRHKAKKPIPVSVREYGVPFLSKIDSMYIHRLQKHGFTFSCESYEALQQKYPHAKSAVLWWCDRWRKPKCQTSIARHAGLREFIQMNPPPKISDKCCEYAKKIVANEAAKKICADLNVIGVRRAEGGKRSITYTSCYTPAGKNIAQFRPLFFWSEADKKEYEDLYGIVHSDCYTVYGFKRTGCVCCPFGSNFEDELKVIEQYEPKLYRAANAIFGRSYEYTRKYRKFKESFKRERRRGGQIDLFDRWDEEERWIAT